MLFSSTLTAMVLRPAPMTGAWFPLGVAAATSDQGLSPATFTARTCTWYSWSLVSPVMVAVLSALLWAWSVQWESSAGSQVTVTLLQ